ncbi:MAG: bifunctional 3-deoxy-7-phosphoheptulonate synthase/chorismate mutase, partial [Bacteroidales bacterium]|nr:bifunctional 3-deoxy-7-phosphoheptulonate synthase/chorismate mutase [Bacteroidales bacterium]
MIIQLNENISKSEKENIFKKVKETGYETNEVKTQFNNYIICVGKNEFDIRVIGNTKGVKDVYRVSDNYKLVSRKWKVKNTIIDLGNEVKIGNSDFTIIAGPCSIESEEQVDGIIAHLVKNKIKIMRAMVFKPRSSPYSYRGIGIEGLKAISAIARKNGIKLISEVMQVSQIDEMLDYIDIFQVGTRNTQNFNLLDALGKVDKPVLIKRGMSGTIEELLHSAEYIFSNGNEKIILCERGIRTFEKAYRNTFDINVIPILKEKTHLPVIADPSHSIGIRMFIEPIALAAAIAGADGITVEIHEIPEKAISD